jgi:hypothetical protein
MSAGCDEVRQVSHLLSKPTSRLELQMRNLVKAREMMNLVKAREGGPEYMYV